MLGAGVAKTPSEKEFKPIHHPPTAPMVSANSKQATAQGPGGCDACGSALWVVEVPLACAILDDTRKQLLLAPIINFKVSRGAARPGKNRLRSLRQGMLVSRRLLVGLRLRHQKTRQARGSLVPCTCLQYLGACRAIKLGMSHKALDFGAPAAGLGSSPRGIHLLEEEARRCVACAGCQLSTQQED